MGHPGWEEGVGRPWRRPRQGNPQEVGLGVLSGCREGRGGAAEPGRAGRAWPRRRLGSGGPIGGGGVKLLQGGRSRPDKLGRARLPPTGGRAGRRPEALAGSVGKTPGITPSPQWKGGNLGGRAVAGPGNG